MRFCLLVALFIAICSVGTVAQTSGQQTNPPPKKQKKPKKIGPEVIILKVIDKTGATGEESLDRSLFARAGILTAFNKKKVEDISPAEIQGTIDQLQIDFGNPDNWTPDNFDKLSEPWKASYVAGAIVDAIGDAKVTPGTKDPSITDTADITIWLYDVRLKKFNVEKLSSHYQYKEKKGDMAVDPKAVAYQAISGAALDAFTEALKAKPAPARP